MLEEGKAALKGIALFTPAMPRILALGQSIKQGMVKAQDVPRYPRRVEGSPSKSISRICQPAEAAALQAGHGEGSAATLHEMSISRDREDHEAPPFIGKQVERGIRGGADKARPDEETLRDTVARIEQEEAKVKIAKDELVKANPRLVVSISRRKYVNRGLTLLDLIQEGNIGLMKAADRYESGKGPSSAPIPPGRIRQRITRAIPIRRGPSACRYTSSRRARGSAASMPSSCGNGQGAHARRSGEDHGPRWRAGERDPCAPSRAGLRGDADPVRGEGAQGRDRR